MELRQERVEQLLKQLEKRLEQLKELEKMTLEEMWETLGFTYNYWLCFLFLFNYIVSCLFELFLNDLAFNASQTAHTQRNPC